ncbi:hypothetical protein BDB00DRAFT_867049 [Zychaea mexicana]|uniref:uncharacterized protein n=1 Tax=Zychaea mexicana TaxID=64656 RepID=UPI0022FE437E|nr:uncharacterized protein BDB00DRAFT_867049 [Zychaea mexicana]KAI9498978.1 hypothetical protein BDB00DRAFT_867049 [Zychaea mexicana]
MIDPGVNIPLILLSIATLIWPFFNGFYQKCPMWVKIAFLLAEAALLTTSIMMAAVLQKYETDVGFIVAHFFEGAFTIMTWVLTFEILAVARRQSSKNSSNNKKSCFGASRIPFRFWTYAYGVGTIIASIVLTVLFGGPLGRAVLRVSTVVYLLVFIMWILRWPPDILAFNVSFIIFAVLLILGIVGSVILFVAQISSNGRWNDFIDLETRVSAITIKYAPCLALIILVTVFPYSRFTRTQGALAVEEVNNSTSQQQEQQHSELSSPMLEDNGSHNVPGYYDDVEAPPPPYSKR